jgi:hypothetical protein
VCRVKQSTIAASNAMSAVGTYVSVTVCPFESTIIADDEDEDATDGGGGGWTIRSVVSAMVRMEARCSSIKL